MNQVNGVAPVVARPKIAVIGTGGTISAMGHGRLDLHDYGTGRHMHADELVAAVPELAQIADILPIRYENVGSRNIGPNEWLALARLINETVQSDSAVAGVVVTHGTATLEETAYFLNLTVKVQVPVVVVGAMRPFSALSSDAGLNLVNAVRVVASPAAKAMGVLVLLNDEINAARDVAKTSNYRTNTFATRDFGILGSADSDRVEFYRAPVRRTAPSTEFDVSSLPQLPRVDIIPAYAGADAVFVAAAVAAGAKGLVSAGLPSGSPTLSQMDAFKAAIRDGVVVVLSSRAGSGRVIDERAAFKPFGFVGGDTLTPQKARILLMLALTVTSDLDEIRRMFAEY